MTQPSEKDVKIVDSLLEDYCRWSRLLAISCPRVVVVDNLYLMIDIYRIICNGCDLHALESNLCILSPVDFIPRLLNFHLEAFRMILAGLSLSV